MTGSMIRSNEALRRVWNGGTPSDLTLAVSISSPAIHSAMVVEGCSFPHDLIPATLKCLNCSEIPIH
jgi:hypothetical protein